MLIKNKIILGFVLLSGVLMVLFSFYIYVSYENDREFHFHERIKHKIEYTTEIFDKHDSLSEKVITSIPEQSEYIFNDSQKQIFSINPIRDFHFGPAFFSQVNAKKEYRFHYKVHENKHDKDGLAIVFYKNETKYYAIITAFNQSGFDMRDNLKFILIYGNLIFIFLIGIAGYLLSYFSLKPLNVLVSDIEAINPNNLNVTLAEHQQRDEVAILTAAFNSLLIKINALVENQRAFISYASHELRTPLAAISGILETSINYDTDYESTKKSLKQAYLELNKLITLTNALLQLSKIESIDSQIDLVPVNLPELLINAIDSFKKRDPAQAFDLFLSDGYAAKIDKITVMGNEELLLIALSNVIDNAVKYSDGARIFIRIEMSMAQEIRINITDSGRGIAPEELARIYEPMTRGSNTGDKQGHGLGLTLTKKIIDLHRGRIELSSQNAQGTTVSLFLPAHPL